MFSKLISEISGPKDPVEEWKKIEDPVVARRTARCNVALKQLLGDSNGPRQPKVGLCFSGGGWRAMSSGCAVLDALSSPFSPAQDTSSSNEGVKLLDTVSHAFGLSGGSWCLFTALAAGNHHNPFHYDASRPMPSVNDHPWMYGPKNHFDANNHQYHGLRHIVYADTVNAACYRGKNHGRLLELASKVGIDSTLGEVLVCEPLGDSLVERWSNFLSNDVLNFVDGGKGVQQPPEKAPGDNAARDDPNRNNKSRKVNLSSLKTLVDAGDFPFVVCSAIADVPSKEGPRMYDWVEISPYFVRNVAQGVFSSDVDHCKGYFSSAAEKRSTETATDLRLHHMMGVCGSAFACDLTAVVGPEVAEVINRRADLGSNPLLGRGVTHIKTKDGKELGNCRDAGVDFNIPLPPMLLEAHRDFDVIVVMDAGANSTNAYELKRAVDLGYIKLAEDAPNPLEKFSDGERVRVYRGAPGHPSIVYFLGLTKRATSQIIYPDADICADLDQVRDNALKQLVPIVCDELRAAQQRINGHGEGAKPTTVATAQPVHFRRTAFRDAPIALRLERDIVGEVKKETSEALNLAKAAAKVKVAGFMSGLRGNKQSDPSATAAPEAV